MIKWRWLIASLQGRLYECQGGFRPNSETLGKSLLNFLNIMNREQLIAKSVNKAVDDNPGIENDLDRLIEKTWVNKVEFETQMFPKYCHETCMVNHQAQEALKAVGLKGKFTNSYGWSKDRTLLAQYCVPLDLKMYMRNMVYIDFWEDSNARERDSFMKQVCKGGTSTDYKRLLMKVVLHYGTNSAEFIKKNLA